MDNLFKRVFYTGVGITATAAEKLQQSIDELVSKGKISEEEGKKVVDDLVKDTESKREALEDKVKKAVESVMSKLQLPTREELKEMQTRLEQLEATVAKPKRTTRKRATTTKRTTTAKKQTTTK